MAWLYRFLWVVALAFPIVLSAAQVDGAAKAEHPSVSIDAHSRQKLVYTLPADKLVRARSLYHWRTALGFAEPLWSILVLLAILNLGWASRIRDWAVSLTQRRWLQGLCFIPLLLLLTTVLQLPLSIVGHHISLAYGQSIQSWGSWFLDWTKALLLDLLGGTVILTVLFAIIRVSPKRWWIWIWLLSLPTEVFLVFILPVVVDPLFNHFEPLAKSNPALVQELERVVQKTGMDIPPTRMFLMRASEKVTSSNAYVTGFGASKRVVVWDTTIKSSPTDEILVVFGHELGHYVLDHIRRGLVVGSVISFFFLWLGFHLARFLVKRYGERWRVTSLEDWAGLAVLLLVLSALSFIAEPIGNAISRAQEHQADVFGEEVVHGIVADPQKVAAYSFQRLGEQFLDYPFPNPFVVFWSYSHPTIAARVAFATSYDPWQPGGHPRYFDKTGQILAHRF
ncbi:MAG TPA: M48 family metallopeptidase [Acidobacteriaceae bacterium]